MKYTMSKDGVEGTNVRVHLRLTRKQIETAKRLAKYYNNPDWRNFLQSLAELCIENEMDTFLYEHGDEP